MWHKWGGAGRLKLTGLRGWEEERAIISAVSQPVPHQVIGCIEILCQSKERPEGEYEKQNRCRKKKKMQCYLTCTTLFVGERGEILPKRKKGGKRKLLFLNLFISHCQKSFCVTSGVSQENRNSEGTLFHLIYNVKYSR